ncbi:glucosaminidase domain-containing protein [Patulibacter sp.]|uniref:glucosaminidase domain-containing protein n=1 Tax=Patulibacter sp. TaxID=1912859 RepID=UPI00271A4628|nr:glucosaminidase domain-containing protein [Patulibacter sp.]MDO9408586.1 glucosaminidase domain-containing protein [Patulibacter sp.]
MRAHRPVLLTVALSGLACVALSPTAGAAPGPPPLLGSAQPAPAVRAPGDVVSPRVLTVAQAPSPVGIVHTQDPGSQLLTRKDPRSPEPGGAVTDGQNLLIRCQINAERKDGPEGSSRIWDQVQLPSGEIAYLPDAFTRTSTKDVLVAPPCGAPIPTRVRGTQGQCFLRRPVRLLKAPRSRAAFLRAAGPKARSSYKATRVPASVILAQAILESDDGKATAGANNFFGIKAQGVDTVAGIYRWGSFAVACIHQPTNESEGGKNVRQIAQFRAYRTMRASFVDHGKFLRENPRYATAFRYSKSPKRFARAIARAGYATDPSYASTLIALIKQHRLTRWD